VTVGWTFQAGSASNGLYPARVARSAEEVRLAEGFNHAVLEFALVEASFRLRSDRDIYLTSQIGEVRDGVPGSEELISVCVEGQSYRRWPEQLRAKVRLDAVTCLGASAGANLVAINGLAALILPGRKRDSRGRMSG